MTSRISLVEGVPLLQKYMEENDVGLTKENASEILGVGDTIAYTILSYMNGAGIVKRHKRGESFYILTDVFDEGRLEEVLRKSGAPELKVRVPRRPRVIKPKRTRVEHKKPIVAIRYESESSGIPSALGILALEQQPVRAIPRPAPTYVQEVDTGIIRLEASGSIKQLGTDNRLLTRQERSHLKSYLKGFEGDEKLDRYECFFVKSSVLARGEYGNIFYVSQGTNSWDLVKRVTLDSSIFRYQPIASTEKKSWANWREFDQGLYREPRYSREEYEKILDMFIDRGDKLVEIIVEKRSAIYLRYILGNIIADRGLENEIKVSVVDEYLYLEKLI